MLTPGTEANCVGRVSPPAASCHAKISFTAASVVVNADAGVASVTFALMGAPLYTQRNVAALPALAVDAARLLVSAMVYRPMLPLSDQSPRPFGSHVAEK